MRLPHFDLGDITVHEFKATCQKSSKSAPGLDGWAAADLSILSDKAYGILVVFLNAIEQEKLQWPTNMHQTRTVFLSKDPEKTDDPLAYRGLKITSATYRKWASTRLRAFSPMGSTVGSSCTARHWWQRGTRCLASHSPQSRAESSQRSPHHWGIH